MKIAANKAVSIAYQVRTAADGVLVDEASSEQPLVYLQGFGQLIPGLEVALEGKKAGDVFDIDVASADAYGDFNDNLVQNVPQDVFMGVEGLEVGMRFIADTDQGPVPVEITAIDGDTVTVDGNHMLAGQDLKFHVEVVDVRDATPEELEHGHTHGEHGHDHDHDGCCGGHEEKKEGCDGHGGCGCH